MTPIKFCIGPTDLLDAGLITAFVLSPFNTSCSSNRRYRSHRVATKLHAPWSTYYCVGPILQNLHTPASHRQLRRPQFEVRLFIGL